MEHAGQFILGTVAALISCAILWQAQNTTDLTGARLVSRAFSGMHWVSPSPAAGSLSRH